MPLDLWQPVIGMGHLVAKAVRIERYRSDLHLQGLKRPCESQSADLLFTAFDFSRLNRCVRIKKQIESVMGKGWCHPLQIQMQGVL